MSLRAPIYVYVNRPEKKLAVDSARRLRQCCHLPDKTSRGISRYICYFARDFKSYSFIPQLIAQPLTVFCILLVGKHCTSVGTSTLLLFHNGASLSI
jgi:hypothetical protein